MPIEAHAPTYSTVLGLNPPPFPAVDQSKRSTDFDTLHPLPNRKQSLATFSEAVSLQKMLDIVQNLIPRITSSTMDALLRDSLFPALVDVADFRATTEKRKQEHLAARLRSAFETDPLEDGMDHPAEEIIGEALQAADGQHVLGWLRAFSLDAAQPNLAASILRCLGRQEYPGTNEWRAELVREGLASKDVEIRDAAAQAAESWGDRDMQNILRAHTEPVSWLRDYIRDVIDDLEG